jgi:hypothetical protein
VAGDGGVGRFKVLLPYTALVLYLLSFGRPMLGYEHMHGLLDHLEVPCIPLNIGWI